METQKLPNSTLILILGIASIITCCCYGIPGLICGIIAIVLANKATQVYKLAPENYSDYGNVKAGKIMGIIGVALSIILLIALICYVAYFGWETIQDPELMQERIREMQEAQG